MTKDDSEVDDQPWSSPANRAPSTPVGSSGPPTVVVPGPPEVEIGSTSFAGRRGRADRSSGSDNADRPERVAIPPPSHRRTNPAVDTGPRIIGGDTVAGTGRHPTSDQAGWSWARLVDLADQYRPWFVSGVGTVLAVVLAYLIISNSGSGPTESIASEIPSVPVAGEPAAGAGDGDQNVGESSGARVSDLARSTVQLVGLDEGGDMVCTGSGVIVDTTGLIVTNAHVVNRNELCPFATLGVAIAEDESTPAVLVHTAEIMAIDDITDLAVVRIDGWIDPTVTDAVPDDFPEAVLGDSDSIELGDRIRIIGYPAIGGDTVTSTSGEVSGFSAQNGVGERALIKTDATISAGHSGGMAVSESGTVIGIPSKARATESGPPVDCRPINDTNGDGSVDDADSCNSVGGFLNGIRPINLVQPLLGEVRTTLSGDNLPSVVGAVSVANPRFSSGQQDNAPIDELIIGRAGQVRLCLFADWDGIPNGTRWDGVWYLNGQPIPVFSKLDQTWEFGLSGGNFWMCATDPDGLEAGEYTVALFLNDELAFAEVIELAEEPLGEHAVTWANLTGANLCGLAVNPFTDHRQAGASELPLGAVIADGEVVTITVPEGLIVAEAYDCDGRPVADALDGLLIDEPATFDIEARP